MRSERPLVDLALSFPLFVEAVGVRLGFDVPDLHVEMAKGFVSGEDYLGLQAFRNSAKSYLAELYVCWRIWLEPRLWVLVVSGEASRAEQFSSAVAGHLQQIPWLKHLAPSNASKSFTLQGVPKGEWPTLTSRTSRGNLRGPRADLVILDDPIGTRDKESQAVRAKVNNALHEIPHILNPAGRFFKQQGLSVPTYAQTRCLALFTPTDRQPNDFYQQSNETENFWNRFEVHRYPAVIDPVYSENGLLESGVSAWPERWPIDELISEQRSNPFVFEVERQVDNSVKEDDRSLVRFSKIPQRELPATELAAFVDPSMGGDEYAYCLAGLARTDEGTRIYVDEVGGWRGLTTDEAAIELLEVMRTRKIARLYAEDNLPVTGSIRKLAKEREIPLAIEGFKSRGKKETRLKQGLAPVLNAGSVIMNPKVLSDDETVRQLRGLRSTPGLPANDDRLDVLEFACSRYEESVRYRDKTKPKRPNRVRYA